MTVFPALALGFALGLRHAMDADHIAAIGTIAGESRSAWRAACIGASWGVGHSLSVLVVGGALVIMRVPMPARLALGLEFLVAIMLVGLGARSLVERGRQGGVSAARPLLIGVVHGLAGSAVLALLVLGTAPSALAAAAYLVCFCIGSVIGMLAVTTLLMMPLRVAARRALAVERMFRVTAGVASIGIGLALAHRIGIREGLFAATPIAGP